MESTVVGLLLVIIINPTQRNGDDPALGIVLTRLVVQQLHQAQPMTSLRTTRNVTETFD
jgi:hypothetical protein